MATQVRLAIAYVLAALTALWGGSAASAQDYTPPPLSAYGELPGIERAALSPSGQRTAAIITIDGVRRLVAFDADNKALATTPVDGIKVRSVRWINEDRILMTYGTTQDLGYQFTTDKFEFTVGLVIPVDRSAPAAKVFDDSEQIVSAIFGYYGMREIGGQMYGFFGGLELKRSVSGSTRASRYVFRHGRPFLYRVNLETNESERIGRSAKEGHDNSWMIDANGNIAATYDINGSSGNWTIKNASGDVIASGKSKSGRSGMIGLGRDGTSLIYYKAEGEEPTERFEVPLAGGASQPFMPDIDEGNLYFDHTSGHLIGYREDEENAEPVFDDPDRTAAIAKVNAAFAQMEDMSIIDWSDDFNSFIVRTTGVTDSGTWFAVDVKNLSARAFSYERMPIGPKQVGHFSTFEYTASDGLEMDGILTLPPGREGKNLPLIMMPHGGPHSQDWERFHWRAQAFASRGYAVFQPNFRGSTNRDRDFMVAGYGEWGGKMQSDISDGLTALAEAGIVDPGRVCILGASYGGYAALAGVTLQQGLYRCSVAIAPVTDVSRIYREDYRASGKENLTKAALLRQLGDPDTWDAVSPHRHADKADAPIMLIHGKDDTIVPYIHSVKMADGLKDHGKPHEFVTLEGEDHFLSLPETRMQMLEAAMRFVQEHNPAD